jgi:hypothetical protein
MRRGSGRGFGNVNYEYSDKIIKLLKENAYSKGIDQVFLDFLSIAAISIQNSVNKDEELEKRYLEIVGGYSKQELENFVEAFSNVVLGLEEKPDDLLGTVFHKLELHNKWKGQFFTPIHISRAMAEMTLGDGEAMQKHIDDKGYITVCEPTCGSGVMVIAMSEVMKKNGLNPQSQMFAVCTDIDLKCVHMTHIQLSLLGIPAQIIHGNSLTLETFSVWTTPLFYMNPHIFFNECIRKNSGENEESHPVPEPQSVPELVSVNSQKSMDHDCGQITSGDQISLFDDLFYSHGCVVDEENEEDFEDDMEV